MALRSFGPHSCALVDYHLERGGMSLHDAVRANCKRPLEVDDFSFVRLLKSNVFVN